MLDASWREGVKSTHLTKDHGRPHRVQVDIPGKFHGVVVLGHQKGLIAALEKVAEPFSLDVEIRGVRAVDVPHDLGQVGVRGLDEEVVVVFHQAVGVKNGPVTFMYLSEVLKEPLPVPLAPVNALSLVASGCYMVKRPGKRNP